ncbi:MAG TPA: hypothetical protein VHU24_09580 [Solirubrobacterales bacterium]|nr:hypothetical protein [Solirubrobacterales bacterium]
MDKGTRRLVAIFTVVAALALAPAAFAQSTGTGYGGIAGQTAQGSKDKSGVAGNNGTDGTAATQASTSNGVLAFTGLDLALLAGGGLVLLASGMALSRLVGRSSAA